MTGLLLASCAAGSTTDQSTARSIANIVQGKTTGEILACAGIPRRERLSDGITAMVYQHDAEIVERSVPGAKSSGPRDVPHYCRATVIVKANRVTDVHVESVPEWLGAEDHCHDIFARCTQDWQPSDR